MIGAIRLDIVHVGHGIGFAQHIIQGIGITAVGVGFADVKGVEQTAVFGKPLVALGLIFRVPYKIAAVAEEFFFVSVFYGEGFLSL